MKKINNLKLIPFLVSTLMAPQVFAADPIAGKTLYLNTTPMACSVCHGTNVALNQSKILKGANNPASITSAINGNAGGMGIYKTTLNATQIADIAAFIANPNAVATTPGFSLSTSSLNFSSQTVGTSTSQTVTVSNPGTGPLNLSAINLGGVNSTEFTKAGTCSITTPVAAGGNCTVVTTFSPTTAGTKSASLSITHNATGSPSTVTLSGTAIAATAPAISLSHTAFSFANQAVGSTSTAQTLTVLNTGTANLNLSTISLTGANASEFSQATGTTCNAGTVLAPNAQCLYQFNFKPLSIGSKTASISIAHNAPNSPSTANLSGSAIAAPSPIFSINSTGVNFGNQTINTTATQALTITNNGDANLNLGVIGITGTNSAMFTKTNTCDNQVILPAQTCSFSTSFTPTTIGAKSSSLNIAHNALNLSNTLSMAGTGVTVTPPSAAFDSSTFSFGNQTTNTNSTSKTFTLTNSGPGTLNITSLGLSNATDFSITGGTCVAGSSIPLNGTCTVITQFNPTSTGSKNSALNIVSNASGALSANLTGTGVAPAAPIITTSVNSLSFGYQAINTASGAKTLTVSNTGNASLSLIGMTLGNGFSKDNASTTCSIGGNIVAGSSCNIGIVFNPNTSADFNTSLLVESNAGSKTIGLTGSSITVTPIASLSSIDGNDFGSVNINTTSTAKTFRITNTGSAVLNFTRIVASSNFALSHNCTASLNPQASCDIQVNFTPITTGILTGTLTIEHNAGIATTANLTGTGVDPNASNNNGGNGSNPTPSNPNGTSNVGNAGGCSSSSANYSKNQKVDPIFFVMIGIAMIGILRRKIR